jgi:1,4-alpha-glucan branching enzyme
MSQRHAAILSKPKRRRVELEAPDAQAVAVTGSFCGWAPEGLPLKKGRRGVWKATLQLPPGRYEYRFVVDGEWRDDPLADERVPNPFGSENCVLVV